MLWDWLPWLGRRLIARRIGYFLTEMIDDADNHRADRHRAERERWLAGGVRRRRMYNETLRRFHAQGWGAGLERPSMEEPAPHSRHWGGVVAAVAAACLLLLSGWLVTDHLRSTGRLPSSQQIVEATEFRTLADQRKSVRLADGSQVTMAPDTDLTASLESDLRRIELRRGTARFSVVHDTRRPFVVWAGGGTTTATGTLFEVSLRPDRTVRVDLIEGSVKVTSPTTSGGKTNPARKLMAGEHIVYPAAASAKPNAQLSEARGNSIHFEYEHLDAVIARLNQHSPVVIELADPSLANLRVYGDCDLHDVVGFVRMIALSLNLDAVEHPGRVVLRAKGDLTPK